jgi:hypothetical protein
MPVLSEDLAARLKAANAMLECFAPGTTIKKYRGGWYVCWTDYRGREVEKRWITQGQDWYPMWHKKWAHGGTASMALSQLIRWLRGQPVVGIGSWRYWSSDTCMLLRHGDADGAIDRLCAAGYPTRAHCVLCGIELDGHDWWHLDEVSGPCCHAHRGCRQLARPGENSRNFND